MSNINLFVSWQLSWQYQNHSSSGQTLPSDLTIFIIEQTTGIKVQVR